MHMKLIVAATMLFGLLPVGPAGAQQVADDEAGFQQMVAALKANDAERQNAIAVCIGQSAGADSAGIAKILGVPAEQAWTAWCTRLTNGIANGKLTLADVTGLNEGTITPGAQAVLTTVSEGK
jgi:hypothetical protein